MSFAPEAFLKVAQDLAKKNDEASRRTAVGRAYYSVYGYITQRMADARGVRRSQLFGKQGKHGALVSKMARLAPFKALVPQYNLLRAARGRADYIYGKEYLCSMGEAARAVGDAEKVLASAEAFGDSDYLNLPLP